jgi:hypothetical protein
MPLRFLRAELAQIKRLGVKGRRGLRRCGLLLYCGSIVLHTIGYVSLWGWDRQVVIT